MDATCKDFLQQEAEDLFAHKLHSSVVRNALGFGLFALAGILHFSDDSLLVVFSILSIFTALYVLIGGTPRILRLARASSIANPAYQDNTALIARGIANGSIKSAKLNKLQRSVKIAFLTRMLGVVAIMSLLPIAQMLSDDGTRGSISVNHVTGEVLISHARGQWYGVGP